MAQSVKAAESRQVPWEAKHFLVGKSKSSTSHSCLDSAIASVETSVFQSHCSALVITTLCLQVVCDDRPEASTAFNSSSVSVLALPAFISTQGFLCLALLAMKLSCEQARPWAVPVPPHTGHPAVPVSRHLLF